MEKLTQKSFPEYRAMLSFCGLIGSGGADNDTVDNVVDDIIDGVVDPYDVIIEADDSVGNL